MIFFSFRIPLFFIVSGLFIGTSLARKSVKDLIISKFDLLFYPYLIWSFIQISLQLFLGQYTNATRDVSDYLYIFYQPRGIDQFWYLPALFNVSFIYILIKAKLKAPSSLQLLLGILFYFLSFHFRSISMISDWMEFYIFFAIGDFVSQQFFKERIQNLIGKWETIVLLTPIFIITQIFYLSQPEDFYSHTLLGQVEFFLIALIGCCCMFVVAFRLEKLNILRFLRVVGYHSLYIYVLHVMTAALTRTIAVKFFGLINPALLLLLCIMAGVTIPIIFYNLFVRNNFAWFLFSFRKNKKNTRNSKITSAPAT